MRGDQLVICFGDHLSCSFEGGLLLALSALPLGATVCCKVAGMDKGADDRPLFVQRGKCQDVFGSGSGRVYQGVKNTVKFLNTKCTSCKRWEQ